MFARAGSFFARHPSVREAALWAVPALLFGGALRLLLLTYLPYGYWGADSRSYYSFAQGLLDQGYISLDEKRRYLYPLLMVPVSLLPGSPLRWVAWLQHGFGLLTVLPLAYAARKSFRLWRLWIVPLTVLYAGLPVFIWYEHELLGDTIFFALLVWMLAGWIAWESEPRPVRARRLWWLFFLPLALFLLTKPSGRFLLPGICVGLVLIAAWRRLDRRQWAGLAALFAVALTVGSKKQAAWLLYVACFPLTVLEQPLHAEYKAEIRDFVEPLRRDLDGYYEMDNAPFDYLEKPSREPGRPLWRALDKDAKKRARVYMDLAKEAILTRPDLFLYLGLQRLVASANPSEFKIGRFAGASYVKRFENDYADGLTRTPHRLRRLFALSRDEPLPTYQEFSARLAPRGTDSRAERFFMSYVRAYSRAADLVQMPTGATAVQRPVFRARPTLLGWWLLAGGALSLLPAYRRSLGVWTIAIPGYLGGVFLVSLVNTRYFAPAWPVFLLLLAVPADLLLSTLLRGWKKRRQP